MRNDILLLLCRTIKYHSGTRLDIFRGVGDQYFCKRVILFQKYLYLTFIKHLYLIFWHILLDNHKLCNTLLYYIFDK